MLNARDLGLYVRSRRREVGLNQSEAARRAGVSRRWLSDFESGKPTAEVGLVIQLISALGLSFEVGVAPEPEIDLDAYLRAVGGPS
ncbi:helix-turn-helix transcriptional regulator [Actinoplanes sp. TBRC 11911]|nr:helix-turn-helix transcriptional regulator [Actinoplanes sp. TBRC 11911]